MTSWKVKYMHSEKNAEISADGNQIMGNTEVDRRNLGLHGSNNFLTAINQSASAIEIRLDGLTTRVYRLFANAYLNLSADEGIYFNTLTVVELDTAVISANAITITHGRAVPNAN